MNKDNRPHRQEEMFKTDQPETRDSGPVTCLGMTFENDEKRREYFLEKLSEKLKDPEFRKIEGFPIGEDEDILALSDPPYYTACPNPWIADFIKFYGKPYDPATDDYRREPFAADVSEGKGDTVYSAHSYHTKVPPQAIARYILHYTEPGDIVLDPFSGSGMTGLASLMCSSPEFLKSDFTKGNSYSARIPIICDLSPAATFISSVYFNPPNTEKFCDEAYQILSATMEELLSDWEVNGKQVDYYVVSEVFSCPNCQESIVTDEVVKMTDTIGAASSFPCSSCGALVSKAPTKSSNAARLERVLSSAYDELLQCDVPKRRERIIAVKYVDGRFVAIDSDTSWYSKFQSSKRFVPSDPLIKGDRFITKDCCASYGITHLHHFYTNRQMNYLSKLWELAQERFDYSIRAALLFLIQSYSLGATRLNRFIPARKGKAIPGSQVNRYFSGTMYIPSLMSEVSPKYLYFRKINRLRNAFSKIGPYVTRKYAISTQDAGALNLPELSVDYIFVDPPFGQNLQYSELNQIWESWLKVKTNRRPEAVVDDARKRNVMEYGRLMREAFIIMYRVLKPGRWITLEFHNSLNSVWTAIQEGLFSAGFIVADVRVLDKQQDTYKQSRQGLVKQDLVISAYKPNGGLEERFKITAGTEDGVWDFVRTHLKKLPVFVKKGGPASDKITQDVGVVLEIIAERQNYLLYDRMVAFHVQRGVTVPLSAAEFYAGLEQQFPCRDGMYFLPEQIPIYDKKRMTVKEVLQLQLFVIDEASAIQWLKQQLTKKPQTFQDIHPNFMKEIGGWQKHEKTLELSELLEQNFLRYDGKGAIPAQIVSWMKQSAKLRELIGQEAGVAGDGSEDTGLETRNPELLRAAKDRWYSPDPNKAGDLEKLRERALMREFEEYRESKQKRLKVFRLEAVRAGFKKAWQARDYATIIAVARKIPEKVLQEDPKLLMWYDQALTRTGVET